MRYVAKHQKPRLASLLGHILMLSVLVSTVPARGGEGETTPWAGAQELIGISADVRLADSSDDVTALWQSLMDNKVLRGAVRWQEGPDLFAVYTGFDTGFNRAELFLGYRREQTRLQTAEVPAGLVSSRLPDGTARIFPVEGTQLEDVEKTWRGLPLYPTPAAVVEHYELSSLGTAQRARIVLVPSD